MAFFDQELIDYAERDLHDLCEDYSCGKPSEEDVRRYAELAARRYNCQVRFDEYSNPEFYRSK